MDDNALEVAIALWRSPARRADLRQRPLPDNVGEVIVLAAGAPERLAQAAARTGERPQHLLEAVRFYLREVLLFDGADAYRVLGVADHADHARIKAHHRALQHWLHPDRRGDDWESIYATRINAAWAELRSPERRAAYDARQLHAGDESVAHRVLVSDWRASPAQGSHWSGWLAVGATVAACLWLAVLVDRKSDMPAPQWPLASSDGPEPPPATHPETRAAATGVLGPSAKQGDRVRASSSVAAVVPPLPVAASRPAKASAAVPPTRPAPVTVVSRPPAVAAIVAATTPPPAPRVAPRSSRVSAATPPPVAAVSTASRPPASSARAAPAVRTPLPSPLQPELDPERARLAHRLGVEVTRYLVSDSGHVPPIWRTVAAQDAAASLRTRLDDGAPRITRIFRRARFGDPAWRIAAERATMTATLRPASAADGDALTLRVELAWHDGRWLVDAIGTEARP